MRPEMRHRSQMGARMRKRRALFILWLMCLFFSAAYVSAGAPATEMQRLMDQYWEKGTLIQYDKKNCASYLLDPLSDDVQTTNCSDFVHDFYLLNYGIRIGHSTYELRSSPYIYHVFDQRDWQAAVAEGTWFRKLI